MIIKDVTIKIGSGATPRGGAKAYMDNGISLIRSQNVQDMSFDYEGLARINSEQAARLNNVEVKSGDILLNITGDSIARCCIVPDNVLPARVNQHVAIIRTKKVSSKYLLYFLQFLKPHLLQICNVGGTRNALTKEAIEKLPFWEIRNTNEVAKILDSFDSKISNNNKINAELESMAKTLYDYWFMQFEFPNEEGKPYKSSGGKMIWNEELKREIPKGWEVKKLSKILMKVNRLFDYNVESRTYDLSIIPSNSIVINDTSSSKKFETNLFSVKKGDLLFGSIRPYLRKAGIASYDGAVAGTIHCYVVRNEYDYNLALLTLSSENLFKYAINNSKGTKMPVVSSDDLLEFLIPYNKDLAMKFNKLSIKDTIIANVHQSNELSSLRDFLLPLLMNGQVSFR